MALSIVPVAFFAGAVQLGVARNDTTVRTVGRDATRGITVAQAIKLNLAELDEIVVQDLLGEVRLGPSGFPQDYNDKRSELNQNLVLAASESASGAAYQQPLANIDYVLAHYHTLVKEAFAAHAGGDEARTATLYNRAHTVLSTSMLPNADFVDKANTYVLNNSYDAQRARSASTGRVIVVSWVAMLVFLGLVQLLLARKFRRLLNPALAAATVAAVLAGGFALGRLDSSKNHLSQAREQAFDSVHVLARARATVVSARESQGQLLLDPASASEAQADFTAASSKLFRVQDAHSNVAELAKEGAVPPGSGGYLAGVAGPASADHADHAAGAAEADEVPAASSGSARHALIAFGTFLSADAEMRDLVRKGDTHGATLMYDNAQTFTALTNAIDEAQSIDQTTFNAHVQRAARATDHLAVFNTTAAAGLLMLVLLGLYQRLREYGK
jgi:hypothetical protein